MKLTRILTIAFFGVLALVILLMFLPSSAPLPQPQLRLQVIVAGAGGMIAVSAALLLLLRALDRDPWSRMAPLIVPLTAGLLLMEPNRMLALVLMVAVAGVFARDLLRGGNGSGAGRRFRRSSASRRETK